MEKSGEAPEAPVTVPWRGVCFGASAPDPFMARHMLRDECA